jgi:dihydroneopterin aldolase
MDKIILSRLQIYAYHGVLPEEKRLGQTFFISLVAELDIRPAAQKDDESLSVCYATLAQYVCDQATTQKFCTLEALTESLAHFILDRFSTLKAITVRVEKPNAPMPYIYDTIAVEIRREQKK